MATITCTRTNNKASSNKNDNFRRIDLKRKFYSRGKGSNFKRFKRTPKFIRDNPENQVAKAVEQDPFHFSDSEEDDHNDLGMGLELTDLPFLDDNHSLEKQMESRALTQDSVRPLFINEESYDEKMLDEALVELRYKTFRPNQKETIKRVLLGRSTLFISPTGSGKSLCYQIPALLNWRHRKCITIVVSPLISLMEDQLANFPSAMRAISLHSNHSRAQKLATIKQIVDGEIQVVFISPESIVSGVLEMDDLRNFPPVGLVCIDEAHCLSEWSHNFRPAYSQFYQILREHMKIKTFLGLTATSTRATTFAIARCLTINPETDVVGSTSIPDNLMLSVTCENNKLRALMNLLKTTTFRHLPSIIIYCNRREDTESIASNIRTNFQDMFSLVGVPERVKQSNARDNLTENENNSPEKPTMKLSWHAEPYHAGLNMDSRKKIQRQFIKGEIRVVVATVAFGMGINKSNIRAIIHYDMPGSFENYVQEIGRAGRDGKLAQCHLFLSHNMTDVYYQQRNIYASTTGAVNIRKLVDYMFPYECTCRRNLKPEPAAKLEKLNQFDPHELTSRYKTDFISQERTNRDDGSDDDDISILCDSSGSGVKDQIKYLRKSVVRKHRACPTHEVSFCIEKTVKDLNLRYESLMTLIIQLQQTYPQLQLKIFPPAKLMCTLNCKKGPAQLEKLCSASDLVYFAVQDFKREYRKSTGELCVNPKRISFNVATLAKRKGMSSDDAIKHLKKLEWELVDKTGSFRRSNVEVKFYGNMFHLKLALDLTQEEKTEISNFLVDYMRSYEKIERMKVFNVYKVFKDHCLTMDQISIKDTRLETSASLRRALDDYYNKPPDESLANPARLSETHELSGQLNPIKAEGIKRTVTAFLSAHSNHAFLPVDVAKILQGISTPVYSSESWGVANRKFWRSLIDVDFKDLKNIIAELLEKKNLPPQMEDSSPPKIPSIKPPGHLLSVENPQQQD